MKRETAWRLFAGEYNDSKLEIKGDGEKTPSYLITPLGSKVNRLFIVGVLTDVENVSEGGDFVRAHISDPTGVFTLYSGQFQQDSTDDLLNIDVPAFVAVVGKIRTYTPDDGDMYVSIKPEIVREVTADMRSQWIIDTCKHTKHRINAFNEAMKMSEPNISELRKLGYSRDLADGIIAALREYQTVDLQRYTSFISEAVQYIVPLKETIPDIHTELSDEELEPKKDKKKIKKEEKIDKTNEKNIKTKEENTVDDSEEIENNVLDVIKKLEGDDGAAWDLIIKNCKKSGLDEDSIEEALTSLMDKGFIFEPVLGTIKTT